MTLVDWLIVWFGFSLLLGIVAGRIIRWAFNAVDDAFDEITDDPYPIRLIGVPLLHSAASTDERPRHHG
jgi:hypothetical protein